MKLTDRGRVVVLAALLLLSWALETPPAGDTDPGNFRNDARLDTSQVEFRP